MNKTAKEAVKAALNNDWEKAISLNKSIISENEKDCEALSRLAYAYTQIGDVEKAIKLYRKVLSLDRYNFVVQKNLEKLKALPKKQRKQKVPKRQFLAPHLFIEEAGKTKTVNLVNLAPLETISKLNAGQQVKLHPKKRTIEIRINDKTYLGVIPDDISFRLIRFLKAGNIYKAYIKNIQKNSLTVFIREEKKSKRLRNQPSFLTDSSLFSTTGHRKKHASKKTTVKSRKKPKRKYSGLSSPSKK